MTTLTLGSADEEWAHHGVMLLFRKGVAMLQRTKSLFLAVLLPSLALNPVHAAEREDVRKVINLVTSVKMPFPESLARNRAKTERVWLERAGMTAGCIRLEDRRWCYEFIAPEGNRAEMLRIRSEPSRGVFIGALYHYMVDFDLDGLIDVGSTTRIEALDQRRPATPIANVIQFFHRSTKRGETFASDYQKMYDEGIQVALRYFGE
jgi:hypothetical protein